MLCKWASQVRFLSILTPEHLVNSTYFTSVFDMDSSKLISIKCGDSLPRPDLSAFNKLKVSLFTLSQAAISLRSLPILFYNTDRLQLAKVRFVSSANDLAVPQPKHWDISFT